MKSLSTITSSLTTLGLPPDRRPKEKKVKRAYRRMALILHPDRAGAGSTKEFQLLQSAYTTVLEFLESRDIMENGEEEEDEVESSSEESESSSSSTSSSDLTVEEYLAKKYPNIQDKNNNLKISDTKKSSMSDLINFTIYMAENFYSIQNRHLLEAIFLALYPLEELFIAHADVLWTHKQVTVYRELLMLGDLPTITQEDRVVDWVLQVERMTYPARLVVMAIKLTGINPKGMKMVMPGGQVLGKRRREVVVYLGILHTIGMVMENKDKDVTIKKMFCDLEEIILKF